MQILTLVWGILAVCGAVVAFFPCLSLLNILNIPFAAVGFVIGMVTLAATRDPRKGAAVTGTLLCGLAVVLGILRLKLAVWLGLP